MHEESTPQEIHKSKSWFSNFSFKIADNVKDPLIKPLLVNLIALISKLSKTYLIL